MLRLFRWLFANTGLTVVKNAESTMFSNSELWDSLIGQKSHINNQSESRLLFQLIFFYSFLEKILDLGCFPELRIS